MGSDLHFRKASYEPGIRDFGTGCFAYLQPDGGWGFSNSGLITDGNEALLVDTMFDDAHTRAMLDGFRRASSAKIGTLVNTHHNGDHCYGNALVEGAEIVATVGATEAMKHETPQGLAGFMKAAPGLGLTGEYLLHCFGDFDFEHCSTRAPDTTFTGNLTRHVGAKAVELIEVGPAHTGGDALVYVPSDKTIFTGDILFIDGHPILWAGPVGNWIAACEQMIAMDVETIVPGHGPITDKRGVRRVADYLTYIRDEAKTRYESGMDALEAARSIALDDFSGWGDAERIAVNTATLYREFGSKDVPSDPATMFGWMAQIWKDRK
jgi:glyoxylase-like metal-dependent hydrolase (beta-lactamase superfamily II)